jgi:hypothetical protein
LISRFFNHVRGGASRSRPDNGSATLIRFYSGTLGWLRRYFGHDVTRENSPMTFSGPLVGRLSVVAAYLAIAFVGAIVLGVF